MRPCVARGAPAWRCCCQPGPVRRSRAHLWQATPWGRFVAVFTMFSGIIIVALPITVIGANFEKQFEKQYFADALTSAVVLEDQSVDYHELWSLMEKLNMRGNLLIPMPASITDLKELVAQYDVQRKGKLDSEDWGCFILDVVCEAHEFTAVTINKVCTSTSAPQHLMPTCPCSTVRLRDCMPSLLCDAPPIHPLPPPFRLVFAPPSPPHVPGPVPVIAPARSARRLTAATHCCSPLAL